ncbi:hypothetical protein ABTE26_17925 [Acinetobacter baumannii]
MSLTPQAIPGMRARLHMPEEILSLPVAGTGVVSDGEVVVQSADGKTVSAVTEATNTKFGVVVFQHVGKSGKNALGKGKVGMGILYLIFCWTLLPAIIAFFEGIIYLCTSDEDFAKKYG